VEHEILSEPAADAGNQDPFPREWSLARNGMRTTKFRNCAKLGAQGPH
jgi:hypothetical protein